MQYEPELLEILDDVRVELKKIRLELKRHADGFEKIVNEGITLYEHQDGPEAHN